MFIIRRLKFIDVAPTRPERPPLLRPDLNVIDVPEKEKKAQRGARNFSRELANPNGGGDKMWRRGHRTHPNRAGPTKFRALCQNLRNGPYFFFVKIHT